MTTTPVFATTLEKSNVWLDELTEELHLVDHQEAYQALRATLHALRDRLAPDEAAHLGAQLPMLIRGMYYDGWKPSATPLLVRNVQDFYALVREYGGNVEVLRDTPRVVTGVFKVLGRHVTGGELDQIRGVLPREIGDLLGATHPVS